MNAFEEFMFDENYVLRFYRVDHGLVCTINESMVPELREVESKLRQQQAEIEALKAAKIRAYDNGVEDGRKPDTNNELVGYVYSVAGELIKSAKISSDIPNGTPLYTHPYKPSKSEVDALLDNADYVVGIMRKEIEEWKRKYKDMHNLATQAMSKVHQLEKEAQEK